MNPKPGQAPQDQQLPHDQSQQTISPPADPAAPLIMKPKVGRRGSTGPRTAEGKKRASRNSLRHRLFAAGVVEGYESVADYERLQERLFEDYRPKTETGRWLVAKLGHEMWRLKRFYEAEAAEIRSQLERGSSQEGAASTDLLKTFLLEWLPTEGGLMEWRRHGGISESCLDILAALRRDVERRGVSYEDMERLTKLYGRLHTSVESPQANLAYRYYACLICTSAGEGERVENNYPSPEERRESILKQIDNELFRVRQEECEMNRERHQTSESGGARSKIPCSPKMELLFKYKPGNDRTIEKTLSLIESLRASGCL